VTQGQRPSSGAHLAAQAVMSTGATTLGGDATLQTCSSDQVTVRSCTLRTSIVPASIIFDGAEHGSTLWPTPSAAA